MRSVVPAYINAGSRPEPLALLRKKGRCRRAGFSRGCCRASAEHSAFSAWHRLLPAAAESFIELHNAQELAQTNLRQRQLRLEEIAVGVKRVQLSVHSSAIPNVSQPRAILQGRDKPFLLHAALAGS